MSTSLATLAAATQTVGAHIAGWVWAPRLRLVVPADPAVLDPAVRPCSSPSSAAGGAAVPPENGYGPHGRMNPARQAETTLAERFAKGDIDEMEYRARLEVLRANASPSA